MSTFYTIASEATLGLSCIPAAFAIKHGYDAVAGHDSLDERYQYAKEALSGVNVISNLTKTFWGSSSLTERASSLAKSILFGAMTLGGVAVTRFFHLQAQEFEEMEKKIDQCLQYDFSYDDRMRKLEKAYDNFKKNYLDQGLNSQTISLGENFDEALKSLQKKVYENGHAFSSCNSLMYDYAFSFPCTFSQENSCSTIMESIHNLWEQKRSATISPFVYSEGQRELGIDLRSLHFERLIYISHYDGQSFQTQARRLKPITDYVQHNPVWKHAYNLRHPKSNFYRDRYNRHQEQQNDNYGSGKENWWRSFTNWFGKFFETNNEKIAIPLPQLSCSDLASFKDPYLTEPSDGFQEAERIYKLVFESGYDGDEVRKLFDKYKGQRWSSCSSYLKSFALKILNISSTNNVKDLKKAYRKLAPKIHPDQLRSCTGHEYCSDKAFIIFQNAYDYLQSIM